MDRPLSDRAACAVLVVLVPSLLLTAAESGTLTLTLTLVTVALAALVRLGFRSVALAGVGPGSTTCPTGDAAPPVPAGRATDPLHHPLRPRAPGMA